MSKVLVTESSLEDIADAIRAKNGTENTYKPGQMAAAIEALPGQSTLVSKSITQNGSYDPEDDDADGYSAVTVNVQPNLQARTATVNGDVYPDAEHDGLSKVTVAVPCVSYAGYAQWQAMPQNHVAGIMQDTHLYRSVATGEPDAYPDELDILPMRATVNNRYQYSSGSGWQQSYQADGSLYGTSNDNVTYAIIVQIDPKIYGKLLIEMAAGQNGGTYTQTHIRLCTDPTLSGWGPNNAGSGLLKQATLMQISQNVSTLQQNLAAVGVIANITSNVSLPRQVIEWDISDLTDPFYLCFHRCRAWVRYYSIKAVKVNAEEGSDE